MECKIIQCFNQLSNTSKLVVLKVIKSHREDQMSCQKKTFSHLLHQIISCLSDFTLGNSLFEAVNLNNNGGYEKYPYSRYGIGLDAHGLFSLSDGSGFGENVIIFGVDNSSFRYDKKNKYILTLVKGITDGLDNITITAKAEYSINFSGQQKKFFLSLYCNRISSYLLIKQQFINLNQRILK